MSDTAIILFVETAGTRMPLKPCMEIGIDTLKQGSTWVAHKERIDCEKYR
jgi:hypothetical protein